MSLAAGRLRDQVTIRRAVKVSDGSGGRESIWEDVDVIAAEVISQNGREAIIAGALQGVSVAKITIRYRPDILTTDQLRVVGDERDWNIRTADDPDRRREQLVILADTASTEV